jgi:predicted membrane-bound spermidine synthase/tetratricopeptide (TPR) repeat protein
LTTRRAAILFFFSGAAGLVYEVAWVRVLGGVLGNTVWSAAIVTSIYMFGLGVGGLLAGRWADRRFDGVGPRGIARAYGIAELIVAVLGAALAFVLPRLGPLSWTTYVAGAHGWSFPSLLSIAARFGLAALLVAPCALFLGSTLPLLVRAVHASSTQSSAWQTGLLYAVNTAGAALGALSTDLFLVPRLGLQRTQLAAALTDLLIAAAAIALARAHAAPSGASPTPTREVEQPAGAAAMAAVALFANGSAALGLEIVWFRLLAGAFGSYRGVLSVLLATILVGLFIGALAGGRLSRDATRAPAALVVSQSAVALATLALLAIGSRDTVQTGAVPFRSIVVLVLVPSTLMGFSFPLANAAAQHAFARVARRTGALYLASTAGSVAGAIAVAFLLLPTFGTQVTAVIMAAVAVIGPLPLLVVRREAMGEAVTRRAFLIGAAFALPAFIGFMSLPDTFLLDRWFPHLPAAEHELARSEGTNEVIVVTEGQGRRVLYTNGHPMSGTSVGAQRYMRAFAHVPLLLEESPARALVICFGVGNTLHAASLHPSLARIEVADLSRHVLEQAHFFAATNHDVLSDPRVHVFVDDGRQYLRASPAGSFDLVTLEPPPIPFAGVVALYSRDFYALAKSRLAPGGMLTQWLPAHQVPERTALAMIRAFLDVFPDGVLLSGFGSQLVLMGAQGGPPIFDVDAVARRIEARPSVAADLRSVQLGTLTELAGSFVADADVLARASTGVAPVTDDQPSLEYAFVVDESARRMPPSIFAPTSYAAWCPKCAGDPRVADLPRYARVLASYYATREFLENEKPIVVEIPRELDPVVRRSAYLAGLLDPRFAAVPKRASVAEMESHTAAGSAREKWRLAVAYFVTDRFADAVREYRSAITAGEDGPYVRRGLALALDATGDHDAAIVEHRRAIAFDPDDADAHLLFAASLRAKGEPDTALAEVRAAIEVNPTHPEARAVLCDHLRARGDAAVPAYCR